MQKKVFRYEKEKRCTCTLYMTESCNLNCVYCYEHIKGKAIIPLEIAQEAIYGISTYQSDMRMAMATSMAY